DEEHLNQHMMIHAENIDEYAIVQEDPVEEMIEEPGRSVDFHLDSDEQHKSPSDTDNSSDWESMNKRSTKYNEKKMKAGLNKISASDDVMGNDQTYQCGQCSRSYKSEKDLKKHLQHHKGQGTFTCPICSKVCNHKRTYRAHMRGHTEQKSYNCSLCPRRFNHKGHLNQHMMVHTGEKPFKCSSCGGKFARRSTLLMHVSYAHNGERPYACSVCQKSFVRKDEFDSHMGIHTGERPFSCSVCDKSYRKRASLKYHILLNHKVDAEELE
uniref:C2H2-type domain-containing protein n=1 Tax=Neogobius melanostomus TaxID=47308 RepID=A0A8C6WQP1_9GOBI